MWNRVLPPEAEDRPRLSGLGLFGFFSAPGPALSALYLSAAGVGLASTVATAHISEAWERLQPAGTGLGVAFGVTNTIWSPGFLTGNLLGGWVLTFEPLRSMLITMAAVLVPFLLGVFLISRDPAGDPDPAEWACLPIDQQDG